MDAPAIQYTKTSDGVRVAHWELGRGPAVVQLPALPYSHIGFEWEMPALRRCYELLALKRTLTRYDGRGTGLSDRNVEDFSQERLVADLAAVVEKLEAPVSLLGTINSAAVAIAYAVEHPKRVSHLLLWCPVTDGSVHLSNPRLDAVRRVLEADWATYTQTVAHALLGWSESEAARSFSEYIQAGLTQETALRLIPAMHRLNVSDVLGRVTCPTLIMHRTGVKLFPDGMIEQVAAAIPGAQLVYFEGSSAVPYLDDWRAVARTIYGFLGETEASIRSAMGGRTLTLISGMRGGLSPREREVVALVVRGFTNREIAEELFLSEKTVENHVGRILDKLELRSRTTLAAYAVEHGIARSA